MGDIRRILILSDIHYAGSAERQRGCTEFSAISNPVLRLAVKAYRHFIWRRDPFGQNHLLDRFLAESPAADYVIANGDYSCDTAFVGVSDPASFESALECLQKLRAKFGSNLQVTLGDHELGKMSLFGGCGGMRLASWRFAREGLGIDPFWTQRLGNYLIMGVASSLIAMSVFEPDILPEELQAWQDLRKEHLEQIRQTLSALAPDQKVILFCHDPTALPFLWRDDIIRARIPQIETTIIGHLHSPAILWKSRVLSGMPAISVLGNSIRRMSTALHEARLWRHFGLRLCPALGGIELLNDGGYYEVSVDSTGRGPIGFRLHRLGR